MRQFEFPYNFDKQLLYTLRMLDANGDTINCIYMPPYFNDYKTISRNGDQEKFLKNMTRNEYEDHISFINSLFPNKIQILLQRNDILLEKDLCQYYLNFGIKKFCVGSIEQAKILKNLDSTIEIIGSISMHLNSKIIKSEYKNLKDLFNGFVLELHASRNLQDIKQLPKQFYYILLINAYCTSTCNCEHHWYHDFTNNQKINCPGILTPKTTKNWKQYARVRPMDLGFFDPYIYIYKLQDRGWPSKDIIRDYILYSTDFSIYPNINYKEEIYYQDNEQI